MEKSQKIFFGIAHINATLNNTIVTITDQKGNTISWASGGSAGFQGAKRASSYAAQRAAEVAGVKAYQKGIRAIDVKIHGFGQGRESSIRGLRSIGLLVTTLQDITSIPHNGCRPSKKRRL